MAAPPRTRRHGWWRKGLLVGVVLWAATIGVTVLTVNVNLIATLILLGSFLIPICVVLFAAERFSNGQSASPPVRHNGGRDLLPQRGARRSGGVTAGDPSGRLTLATSPWAYVATGFIEEFVKGVVLVVVGWRFLPKTVAQGALLGAVVGAGFAAFESAGYAFNAAITAQGIDLVSLVQTEVLRAALSPIGHVLWTAILGAALFGASRDGRHYRFTVRLVLVSGLGVLMLVLLLRRARRRGKQPPISP